MRTTGKAGRELIKEFEQLRLTAYKPHQDDKWTIGWGHTPSYKGQVITAGEAEALFNEDVFTHEEYINKYIRVYLSQNQFDAISGWVFNVGGEALRRSTLVKELNKGHYDRVPAQLKRWNKSGGRVMRGLTRRRSRECELWERTNTNEKLITNGIVDVPQGRGMGQLVKSSKTVKTGIGGGGLGLASITNQLSDFQAVTDQSTGLLNTFSVNPILMISIVTTLGCGYLIYNRWRDSRNGRAY